MLPVLFSAGPISISSFGLFLSLGFLLATFLIWRLAKGWDLNEEKILDLVLLSSFGGLVGARIYFVLSNFEFFSADLYKVFLITKYPGLNFWGALIGGAFTAAIFARRFKFNVWQIGDLAAVGLLAGIVLGDLGCLLSGCDIGILSNAFFAVNIVGVISKRFPVQALEAILVLILLLKIWPMAVKFHFHGKILSLVLVSLGFIKLITQFFRDSGILGFLFSLGLIAAGVSIYYYTSKANIVKDLKSLKKFIQSLLTDRNYRQLFVERIKKSWYNQEIGFLAKQRKLTRILRRVRVKPTPKNI